MGFANLASRAHATMNSARWYRPVSFRQPTMTARMAMTVDDLSGGRLTWGPGAGWREREHTNYGWELLDDAGAFARFEEGLRIIAHLLHDDAPFDFEGVYRHFVLKLRCCRGQRRRPASILIGGNGTEAGDHVRGALR